jgi:hypothetical protein
MGAKVDFEFVDKDFKILYPICRVGRVHKPWFKPTHHGTVEVQEDKEDLLIIREGMRMVLEVEVTGNQKTAKFP